MQFDAGNLRAIGDCAGRDASLNRDLLAAHGVWQYEMIGTERLLDLGREFGTKHERIRTFVAVAVVRNVWTCVSPMFTLERLDERCFANSRRRNEHQDAILDLQELIDLRALCHPPDEFTRVCGRRTCGHEHRHIELSNRGSHRPLRSEERTNAVDWNGEQRCLLTKRRTTLFSFAIVPLQFVRFRKIICGICLIYCVNRRKTKDEGRRTKEAPFSSGVVPVAHGCLWILFRFVANFARQGLRVSFKRATTEFAAHPSIERFSSSERRAAVGLVPRVPEGCSTKERA